MINRRLLLTNTLGLGSRRNITNRKTRKRSLTNARTNVTRLIPRLPRNDGNEYQTNNASNRTNDHKKTIH